MVVVFPFVIIFFATALPFVSIFPLGFVVAVRFVALVAVFFVVGMGDALSVVLLLDSSDALLSTPEQEACLDGQTFEVRLLRQSQSEMASLAPGEHEDGGALDTDREVSFFGG